MIETKLLRAIERSEQAYSLYKQNQKYFQALRIFKANKVIYQLLEEYLFICSDDKTQSVNNYLFHLEDWMVQFQKEEIDKKLADSFVFERLDDSIAFPHSFKTSLL